jgi:hypothetical protein
VLTWGCVNLWAALVYLAALPLLGLFAWYYRKFFLDTRQAWHYRRNMNTGKLQTLRKRRNGLYDRLDNLLNVKREK